MEKFVTTRAEYQWDGERYALVSQEGFWYDGQWALGKGDEPPPPPDPTEIARADARFNRIDQFTPYGSLTYSGPDRNQANLNLSPEVQRLVNQQFQSDSNLLSQALQRQGMLDPNPIDLSQFGPIQSQIDTQGINFSGPQLTGLPNLQAPELQGVNLQQGVQSPFGIQGSLDTSGLTAMPQDIQQFRGDVEQAVFDRGRGLLDPVFADQERALEQRLANQGLPTSGEAYDRDVTRFGRGRNEAFTNLANQAVITGGQEASRALGDILSARGQGFGEQLAGGQFANQAAGQGFNQALASGQFGNDAQLSQAGFNNQVGLLGLGADQGIRSQLTGEQFAQNAADNQASGQNLALQQQLLQNQNAARSQGLAEAQGVRGNQFNELASLLGLQQVQAPQMQNFFAPGQANVTGAHALNQQGQWNAYNAQQNQSNALMSGLFGLGGAFLGGPAGGAALGNLAPNIFG